MGAVISLNPDTSPLGNAVERLVNLVSDDLDAVNDVIVDRMQSPVEMIPTLAGHLISSGGKRLRPLLTLSTARMLGVDTDAHVKLAAAVEFIHTATLLHDDVIDESVLRRGKTAANVLWGNKSSVLVGDFLFSRSFRLMVEVGSFEVLDILSNAAAVIAEGEVMQLSTAKDTATSEEDYMAVIEAKTAALFAAAARSGGIAAGATKEQEDALDQFGRNLGIAFQLVDDALDYSGRQATLGKTVGDDFRDGKITLPVVLAYRRGTDEERTFWQRTLEEGHQEEGDLHRATRLMEKYNTISDTIDRATKFGNASRGALTKLPEGEFNSTLSEIIDFCVSRAY